MTHVLRLVDSEPHRNVLVITFDDKLSVVNVVINDLLVGPTLYARNGQKHLLSLVLSLDLPHTR